MGRSPATATAKPVSRPTSSSGPVWPTVAPPATVGPRSAGSGGDVVTRPDSRDAPHLFGLGLKEMLADEITAELRNIRAQAILMQGGLGIRDQVPEDKLGQRKYQLRLDHGACAWHSRHFKCRWREPGPPSQVRFSCMATPSPCANSSSAHSTPRWGLRLWIRNCGPPPLAGVRHAVRHGARRGLDTSESPPVNSVSHDSDNDGVVNEIPTSLVDIMEFPAPLLQGGVGRGIARTDPSRLRLSHVQLYRG